VSNDQSESISRRAFVRQTGVVAGGALLGASAGVSAGAAASSPGEIARRVLGKTGVPLTILTLGTAPCGFAKPHSPENVARCVNAAIDLGINAIDTAPAYDVAEQGVGMALGKRRKDVFLSTKVMADEVPEAEKILANSLRVLKTDYVDLAYFHSVGDRKVEIALDPDGVLTWLVKQKKAGKIRFVGISGHNRPPKYVKLLESGEVDVLLTVVNFVDRHTYNFEDKVLPAARKHNVGIVAMKVFGGAKGGKYEDPNGSCELDSQYLELAVRYSLGVPGVATLDVGAHNVDQIRKNVAMVKKYKPLSAQEQEKASRLGRQLAAQWKLHFGPIAGMPRDVSGHV
jgi:predicted aldo/keto reductase-like oxidoreductase